MMRWEHMSLLLLCRSKQDRWTFAVCLLCLWGWAYEGICYLRMSPACLGLGCLHSDANAACYSMPKTSTAACSLHARATMQLAIY